MPHRSACGSWRPAGEAHTDIRLDATSNEFNAGLISFMESRAKVRVIKTNEDLMIARHVSSIWDGQISRPTSCNGSLQESEVLRKRSKSR
jgi:hypothetical protein